LSPSKTCRQMNQFHLEKTTLEVHLLQMALALNFNNL